MGKLVISLAGTVLKEVELQKFRTNIGRRPHNDIVLDNLAISADHAAILVEGNQFVLEDLGSTNGSLLNGVAVKRAAVKHDDIIELGKYRIRIVGDPSISSLLATKPATSSVSATAAVTMLGFLTITNGPNAGKKMRLDKPVTTLGRTGAQIVAIHRSEVGYSVRLVEGSGVLLINNRPVGPGANALNDNDQLEVMRTHMRFNLEQVS